MWLFNDALLYAKDCKTSYTFKKEVPLNDKVKAVDVSSKLAMMLLNDNSNLYFQVVNKNKLMIFKASTLTIKNNWITHINQRVCEINNN